MANMFSYVAVYADGHVEKEDMLLLWYLGGKPNVENQQKLADLRAKKDRGEIVELSVYFES